MLKIDGTNYSVEGNVALIGANNGPVNSLGFPLRSGLKKSFEKAVADPNVEAIVFYGEGRTFPAGADISEFKTGKVNQLPLPAIFVAIEDSPKPCIAAVHGTALGGGCELALSCHYRIATDKSKFGLPEVQLGLLPGAGGTQRLPRVVGPLVALEMISSGAPIGAWKAEQVGLVDHVVDVPKGQHQLNFLKQHAVYFAQSVMGKPFESRRVRHQPCEQLDDFYFDTALMNAKKAARGHVAPAACIACVRAATQMPINEGFAFEKKNFFKLAMTPESRSLQHVFFAQRAVTKIPGIDMSLAKIPKKVGIIGAGTMGAGIAMCFAQKGIEVVLKDIKKEYCARGMKIIKKNWTRSARKGKWSAYQVKSMLKLVTPSLDYADLADCDMVIEAVFENMDLKKKIFKSLDAVCKPGCVLATNTSTLDVDEIANSTSRPESVIGMHFFSPANVMKLLENVKGAKTSNEVIATATAVGKLIGKIPVLVGNGFGFVGNRCIFPYSIEAEGMVLEGASPFDVDKAIYKFGMPIGPFQMSDLSGVDVGAKIRTEQFKHTGRPEYYVNDVSDELHAQGLLGQKTKQGWYDYNKSRRGKPSPQTLAIVEKVRAKKGITPRTVSAKEMEERCFYALICEGFRCLEDGVAARPLDIDGIMMFGYGFPVTKGGPMFYADRVGLKKILKKVKEFHAAEPKNRNWNVPALLQKCVDQNVGVYKYYSRLAKKQAKL